jgi:hypothetical protein
VLSDAVWRFKRRIAVLAIFGGVGVFIQGGALGAALLYARSLESGDPVTLPLLGREFDPRADVELLWLVAVLLTAALLVGGYSFYRFKSGAIAVGREYESRRLHETLAAVSRLPHPKVPDSSSLLDEAHIAQVQRDARFCGRVLRKIIEGFVPVVVVPVAGLILLVMNPILTVVLGLLTAAAAASMFRSNRRGARASERMERFARDAMQERKGAIRRLLAGDLSHAANRRTPDLNSNKPVRRHLDAYTDRLQAIEDSGLASSVVTALALGIILLLEGRAVLTGDSAITTLLSYLVVLRIFLTHLMRLSRSVAAVSRFYPQVKRHFTFADRAAPATTTPPPPTFPCALQLPPLHAAGGTDGEKLTSNPRIEAGHRILLLTEGVFTRKSLGHLSSALTPLDDRHSRNAHIRLAEAAEPAPEFTPLEAWGFAPDTDLTDLRGALEELASSDAVRLLDEPDCLVAGSATSGTSEQVHRAWILGLLAALSWRPHALVVYHEHWQKLPPTTRRLLVERAQRTVLVFVAPLDAPPMETHPDLVVLATSEELLGWSSPDDLPHAVEQFRATSRRSEGAAAQVRKDRELLEEEEEDE